MQETVESLAGRVAGSVRGDAQRVISGAATVEAARAGDITFISTDDKNLSRLKDCQAGCVIISAAASDKLPESPSCSVMLVADPQAAFQTILPIFRPLPARAPRGISPQAFVSPTAIIGNDCHIGPAAFIGDDAVIADGCEIHAGAYVGATCRIGAGCVLNPHVVLYYGVIVGERTIIHANAVIGADGFGYRFAEGRFHKIPQLGHVEIGSDVEIGACTTIDRGAVGPTVVQSGTKIDNLVMVAHNCQIGQHNVFASQVGLAGSCTTGDYVRMAGQVGIRDHVNLGTGCSIGAKAGVVGDIPAGEAWVGIPATHESEQKRLIFTLKKAPEMRDALKSLTRQVASLSEQLAALQSQQSLSETRKAG